MAPSVSEGLTSKFCWQGNQPVARACYFDTERGFGAFASLPLVQQHVGGYNPDLSLGLRYSSPTASAGVIGQPLSQQIRRVWAVSHIPLHVQSIISQLSLEGSE